MILFLIGIIRRKMKRLNNNRIDDIEGTVHRIPGNDKTPEKVILVQLIFPKDDLFDIEEDLIELELLANTAGGIVVDKITQKRNKPNPACFIGSGKVQEMAETLRNSEVNTIIFNHDLKPMQIRNIGRIVGDEIKIVDRSSLILDIFAKHAKTPESKIQVELAQLKYLLPRLAGMWKHLERQYGTIGVRGPGEKQLETDKREIAKHIRVLNKKLLKIEKERKVQSKRRSNLFRVAIVGYTNAGKTSLLNKVTGADSFVADMLFATLDSTTRRTSDGTNTILITDTIGFIKKLPHNLIESFKSTLSEAKEADLLLIIADGSHPAISEHLIVVNNVLDEIKAPGENRRFLLINKIDKLTYDEKAQLRREFPNAFFISVIKGNGISSLKDSIFNYLENLNVR
jgi:GTP-binding protein HflX